MSTTVHSRSWADRVPASIGKLVDLAYDLGWTYNSATRQLMERIDPELYTALGGNPVALLQQVSAERLTACAEDDGFVADMNRVWSPVMAATSPNSLTHEKPGRHFGVAYFCAEYALTEVLPFYSGGLGVLAGDHFKAAADLELPFVAIGLAYREGYFMQTINGDGRQDARPQHNAFESMPMELMTADSGESLEIHVPIAGRQVKAQIWQVRLGKNRLYLLDTDVDGNNPDERAITSSLYGGDTTLRIRQELVLGVGGVRALKAVGCEPTVYHMNEGHAAFMVLERLAVECAAGSTIEEALKHCAKAHVFTTHTPVPAGFDIFSNDEMWTYLPSAHERLNLSRDAFMALGGPIDGSPAGHSFNMAYLAMRTSTRINGVSKLHGNVSRAMWQTMWPDLQVDDVPISHVTNGVHVPTWQADSWADLADGSLDAAALWNQRNASREMLVDAVRRRAHTRCERLGEADRSWIDNLLDPNVLTIGFARRFATYKRATLLLRQVDRLRALLGSADRPVQFLFAGKAHPKDLGGQALIQDIVNFSKDPSVRGRFQFLEGYDMALARELVEGVDVWLNNPRRPKEASGTSGMKVVLNGGLNLSILDGWWDEAYDGKNGWAIGGGELFDNPDEADHREAELLLGLLEDVVVPTFYDRNEEGIPVGWVDLMRHSMSELSYRFSTERMVKDYVRELYLPTHETS